MTWSLRSIFKDIQAPCVHEALKLFRLQVVPSMQGHTSYANRVFTVTEYGKEMIPADYDRPVRWKRRLIRHDFSHVLVFALAGQFDRIDADDFGYPDASYATLANHDNLVEELKAVRLNAVFDPFHLSVPDEVKFIREVYAKFGIEADPEQLVAALPTYTMEDVERACAALTLHYLGPSGDNLHC